MAVVTGFQEVSVIAGRNDPGLAGKNCRSSFGGKLLRRAMFLFAFFATLFGAHGVAFAVDAFPGTTISGTGSLSASNVGATAETGEPGSWAPINSMWYSWTAATSGTLVVQTCSATGTTFDTTLAAYTGAAVNALTLLANNDDTSGCATSVNAGYGSRVTLQVSQGTTYRIQVDGYSSATGTFLLQYTFTPAAITVATTDASATEGGDTAAFTVRLATQPSANTTVTIGADPSGQCTFAPTTLTFTTANFATAQTVTATAVNDTSPEGVHSCSPGSITAAGSNYSTVTGTPPTLTVNDNDQGILVATTVATATEGGANGAFTLRLTTLPTGNVTVTIAADPATPDQCTFAPTTLTFTTANWNVAQTVTTTAVNDAVVEGPHSCTTGAITAAGGGYAGVTGTAPTFTITDNDTGALTVATTVATATEGGANGAFTVVLTAQPASNVTVTIGADPATPDQCTFTPTTLTFTNANWNTAQTVTATAVNDTLVEGTHSCTTGTIASSGSGYTATGTAPTFTITDNDTGALTVATTVATATEGGANGAFTVVLTAQPASNVTVTIGADPATPDQCTFAPTTLTFTNANWNTAQTVTATAVNDTLVEGTHSCTTGTITSSGSGYSATGTAPTFTITDNDVASITLVKNASVASVAMPGDVINYTIVITNTGNVNALNITVSDSLTSVTCPTSGTSTIVLLAPAANEICTASYTVTQADFDNNGGGDGDIDNSASAVGTGGGVPVSANGSASVASPQIRTMSFEKTSPAPTPLVANQTVTYSFRVRNTGNVTLTDVSITEELFNGALPLGTPANEILTDNAPLNTSTVQSQDSVANNGVWSELKPNDEVVFTLDYIVQQADIDMLQ